MVYIKRQLKDGVAICINKIACYLFVLKKPFLKLSVLVAALTACISLLAVSTVHADSVTISYESQQPLVVGSLVSLTKAGSTQIQKAATQNQDLLAGVVTQTTDTVINVQPAGSNVPVVNRGRTQMLVSTAGGDIKSGDDLIVSPIAGLAMKPGKNDKGSRYVAVARSDFSSRSNGAQKMTIQGGNNTSKDVYVGLIQVDLALDKGVVTLTSGDQNILTQAASRLTGQQVTTSRVMASSAIAVSSIAVTGMLLQGAVRGTFLSLGRNPLAHANVMPALLRVIILAVVFLGCGFTIAYATLVI